MATVIIPLKNIPNQKLAVVLAGQNCLLRLYQRKDSLFLDLTVNSKVIVTAALCGVNRDLIGSSHPDFIGTLFFADLSGYKQKPVYELLNTRFLLCYYAED